MKVYLAAQAPNGKNRIHTRISRKYIR